MDVCCACGMHGSGWLGPACKRSGRRVVSVFGGFARLREYAYEITTGQFLNSGRTSVSCLKLAERPTQLSTGGFSKMMLYSSLLLGETSLVYCDVGGGRTCICREGVSGCTANIYVGLFI